MLNIKNLYKMLLGFYYDLNLKKHLKI